MIFDDMPLAVRRARWGWFGEPWWSYICFDEEDALRADMRKPFPTGERCLHCDRVFDEAAGDSGQATPVGSVGGSVVIRHAHKECQFMTIMGSLAHHERRCGCYGGDGMPEVPYRQQALEVWRRFQAGTLCSGEGP